MPPLAAVDVLGHLPGPVSKTNAGAGDLLAGEVFAYAVSSSIAVVDVSSSPSTQLICWPLHLAGPLVADAYAVASHRRSAGASPAARLCPAWRTQISVCHSCSMVGAMAQLLLTDIADVEALPCCCRCPECFTGDVNSHSHLK